ncbi:MAG: alcohol dehydrogenase catalytic domain-containing protein [Euryarchaeota archaeon]|nr:alcohol dehydrogenase catalytic domain-containing protein [Euryarchaeota archaeon]
MRAAMYYKNSDVRVVDVPKPKIGSGEALLKVKACGICGSDVMEWYRVKRAPLVLGHEATGDIAEVGPGVKGFKVGDRVFVSHHVPCGVCHYCTKGKETSCDLLRTTNIDPGGFAEFARIPEINVQLGLYHLPEEMSYAEGTFIEPLGCVLRGLRQSHFHAGNCVVVLGSGIAGLLQIKAAIALGAGPVIATDVSEFRLGLAKKAGALAMDACVDVPDVIRKANHGRLADIVMLCTGAMSAIEQAMKSVDRGGTILFFATPAPGQAVPLPANEFWRDEVTVTSSYGAGPRDLREAIAMLRSRRVLVEDLITHRLPLAEAAKGFQLTAEAKDSLKVILEP